MPKLFNPGDIVGKRGKAGWTGEVKDVQGRVADVQWALDKHPTLEKIDALVPKPKPKGWDKYGA